MTQIEVSGEVRKRTEDLGEVSREGIEDLGEGSRKGALNLLR
jgi:hypothetical protein